MSRRPGACAISLMILALFCTASTARAQDKPVADDSPDEGFESAEQPSEAEQSSVDITGFHARAALALRPVPLGLKLDLDLGYRLALFDSESLLLNGTYIEAGATTVNSPSNFWGGAYIEVLPLAVLKLRVAARSMSYFGTFGYLYLPDDPNAPDWSLDAMDGPVSSGHAAHGYMIDAQATLQAKVGNFVAMVPAQWMMVDMDVDQVYYESNIDFLLAPREHIWLIQPTVGYVFAIPEADTWILGAFRWEHAQTIETDLTRDLPQILAMWKLPGSLAGGEMQLVGLGGYWLKHPNREGGFYSAVQFSADWRF